MKSPEGEKQHLRTVLPKRKTGEPGRAMRLSDYQKGLEGVPTQDVPHKNEPVRMTRLSDHMRAVAEKKKQQTGTVVPKTTHNASQSTPLHSVRSYEVRDKRSNIGAMTGADLDALRGRVASANRKEPTQSPVQTSKEASHKPERKEDAGWKEVREAYREHKMRLEEAQETFMKLSKVYEDDRHNAGFFGRFLEKSTLDEKKKAMVTAQKKYDALLDEMRGKRQERMRYFMEKKLLQKEKIDVRTKRYVARNEALLERYIDNEVQLLEALRFREEDTGESRNKYLRGMQRGWNWYKKLPKGKRLGIAALSGAVVGGALGATGLVAGGAAVVGATYATRRAVGGFFGSIVALEAKRFGDKKAEEYGERKKKEQQKVFSEQALSDSRKARLTITGGVRTRKKLATVGAAGAAVAVGAGTAHAFDSVADVMTSPVDDIKLERSSSDVHPETGPVIQSDPNIDTRVYGLDTEALTEEPHIEENRQEPPPQKEVIEDEHFEKKDASENSEPPEDLTGETHTLEEYVPPASGVVGSGEEFVPVSAGDISAVEEYAIAEPERIVVPKAELAVHDEELLDEETAEEHDDNPTHTTEREENHVPTSDGSEAMEDTMVEIADLYEQLEAKESLGEATTQDLEAQHGAGHVMYGTEEDHIVQEAPQELKMEGVYEKGSSVEREFQQFLAHDAWIKEHFPDITEEQRGAIAHRIRLELEQHPDMAEKLNVQGGDWDKVLKEDSYSFYIDRALVEREIHDVLEAQPMKEGVGFASTPQETETASDDVPTHEEAVPVFDESKKSSVQESKSVAEETLEALRQQKEKGMVPPEVDGDNEADMPGPSYVPVEDDPVVPHESAVEPEVSEKERVDGVFEEPSEVIKEQEPIVPVEETATQEVVPEKEVAPVEAQEVAQESELELRGETVRTLEEDMERAKHTMREAGADYQGGKTRPAIEALFKHEGVFSEMIQGQRPVILSNWGPMSHARLSDIMDSGGSLTYTIGEGTPIVMGPDAEQLCRSIVAQLERGLSEKIPTIDEMVQQGVGNNATLGEFVATLSERLEEQEQAVASIPSAEEPVVPVETVDHEASLMPERMSIDEYERPTLERVTSAIGAEGSETTYRAALPPLEVSDATHTYVQERYIEKHPEWEQGTAKAVYDAPEADAFRRAVNTQLADIAIGLRNNETIPLPNITIDWHAFEGMSPRDVLEQLEQHERLIEEQNTIEKITDSEVSITSAEQ